MAGSSIFESLPHSHENVGLLIDVLSTFKLQFENGITEYALISQLQGPPYELFNADALSQPLTLFQTHFVLFHALYSLRKQWRGSGIGELHIHATRIALVTHHQTLINNESMGATSLAEDDSLARYYLDWNNLNTTSEADIDTLLDSFWLRMAQHNWHEDSQDTIAQSHYLLGLPQGEKVTYSRLKLHYRRQLAKVHPDKGGSQTSAQKVISAYQCLKRYYGLT